MTHLAIALMQHQLSKNFGQDFSPLQSHWHSRNLASARALAEYDRHEFQLWAVGIVTARPMHDGKKGADRGIDGEIPFFDDHSGKS